MITKRVLIIGPETGGIPQSIVRAFEANGWRAELLTYGPPRMNLVQLAIQRVVDPHCDKVYRRAFNQQLRAGVFPSIRRVRPDLLLVLKGDYLDDDAKEFLASSGVPLVLWTLDSLSRAPAQQLLAEMAVHTFYIDGGDKPEECRRSSWLPLGYDQDIYHPRMAFEKDIDVLLIGSLGKRYGRRKKIIKMIAGSQLAKKWHCAFVGSTGTAMGNLALQIRYGSDSPESVRWLSRRVPPEHLASFIARAKVCLNVHQDDGEMPVNPMFFAIPATGTCQLAEEKSHLHRWLVPGRDYAEFSDENLVEVLTDLLTDEGKRLLLCRNGCEASMQHTFGHRVKSILAVL